MCCEDREGHLATVAIISIVGVDLRGRIHNPRPPPPDFLYLPPSLFFPQLTVSPCTTVALPLATFSPQLRPASCFATPALSQSFLLPFSIPLTVRTPPITSPTFPNPIRDALPHPAFTSLSVHMGSTYW
eukprot:scaffold55219_cov26-Tisochrysis_lutea.AAC.1